MRTDTSWPPFARLVRCSRCIYARKLIFRKLSIWKMCQKQLPASCCFLLFFCIFCGNIGLSAFSAPAATIRDDDIKPSRPNIRMQSEKEKHAIERKMHEEIKNHHLIKIVRGAPFHLVAMCSHFNAIFIYSTQDSNRKLHGAPRHQMNKKQRRRYARTKESMKRASINHVEVDRKEQKGTQKSTE